MGLDAFSPILFAVDLAHGPTRGQFRLRCPVAYLPKHLGAWYGSRSKPRLKRNSPSRATRPRGRASTVLCYPLLVHDADLAGCPVEHLIFKDAGSAQARVHLHEHPGSGSSSQLKPSSSPVSLASVIPETEFTAWVEEGILIHDPDNGVWVPLRPGRPLKVAADKRF